MRMYALAAKDANRGKRTESSGRTRSSVLLSPPELAADSRGAASAAVARASANPLTFSLAGFPSCALLVRRDLVKRPRGS